MVIIKLRTFIFLALFVNNKIIDVHHFIEIYKNMKIQTCLFFVMTQNKLYEEIGEIENDRTWTLDLKPQTPLQMYDLQKHQNPSNA